MKFGRTVKLLDAHEWREMTEEDHKAAVDELALPDGIGSFLLRRTYDRARVVLLFSWYAPELSEVAELEALRGLEFILKTRLGEERRHVGLRKLLRSAAASGIIAESPGLSAARFSHFAGLDFLEALGADWSDHEVLMHLTDWLPGYRNDLAHGGQQHMPGGYAVLRVVRELILQAVNDSSGL